MTNIIFEAGNLRSKFRDVSVKEVEAVITQALHLAGYEFDTTEARESQGVIYQKQYKEERGLKL